jgi:hypothetical protein
LQSSGKRPEAFYFVDVNITNGEYIIRIIDSQMFEISDINQSVIATPSVRMNHRIERNTSSGESSYILGAELFVDGGMSQF